MSKELNHIKEKFFHNPQENQEIYTKINKKQIFYHQINYYIKYKSEKGTQVYSGGLKGKVQPLYRKGSPL